MHKEEEAAKKLLASGQLDGEALRSLGESRDGQKVKALLGDEKALAEAVRRGDAATLQSALQTLLSTPEGRRLFDRLGGMLGKR